MSWRLVGVCCCLGVAISCGKSDPGRVEDDLVAAESDPCVVETSTRARGEHLGDGTTDYHYYVISDFLRENEGSEAETRETERQEREAATGIDLKAPSAGIEESEFSHLLGVIARSNGGIGAAVFDPHGLMVGAAGVVLEGIVLPAERLATLSRAAEDPPVAVQYTCANLRERAQSCDSSATRGPPCWAVEELADDCEDPVTVYYRPVLDHRRDSRFLGVGMLVVRDEPPCTDARQ